MAKVYLGTSGFSYPHWGQGIFYPQGLPQRDWFSYYVERFNAVELNVSFYRLPKKEVFTGWRKKAGKDFVFSVKASRYLTHIKKLKDCQEPVKRFFAAASGLNIESRIGNQGKKIHNSQFTIQDSKNVILWQLPPRFKANYKRLESFLKILPPSWRYAFEFRHQSWLNQEAYRIIKKYQVAIVFQDFPDWPITEKITTNFVYLRFHGKTSLYSSCYTEEELAGWAEKIKVWLKKGLDCYAFFNNDALGYAIENARTLKKLAL